MSYDKMTLTELKVLCKDRGLKVSGTKNEVIIRLMEYDEGSDGNTASNVPATQTGSMPVDPNYRTETIVSTVGLNLAGRNDMLSTIGNVVIFYGVFRMLWALGFAAFGGGSTGWLLAPVAFIVASMFIFSGIMLTNAYKNGITLTIITFIISGTLSIVLTGQDINPLSISLADDATLIPLSMMCTLLGIGIAALPLVFYIDDLEPGWPPAIQKLINNASSETEKKETKCPNCSNRLLIPVDYSGKASCPSCKTKFDV